MSEKTPKWINRYTVSLLTLLLTCQGYIDIQHFFFEDPNKVEKTIEYVKQIEQAEPHIVHKSGLYVTYEGRTYYYKIQNGLLYEKEWTGLSEPVGIGNPVTFYSGNNSLYSPRINGLTFYADDRPETELENQEDKLYWYTLPDESESANIGGNLTIDVPEN